MRSWRRIQTPPCSVLRTPFLLCLLLSPKHKLSLESGAVINLEILTPFLKETTPLRLLSGHVLRHPSAWHTVGPQEIVMEYPRGPGEQRPLTGDPWLLVHGSEKVRHSAPLRIQRETCPLFPRSKALHPDAHFPASPLATRWDRPGSLPSVPLHPVPAARLTPG